MAQGFDPAAATQAYLSILTPEQHLKAQHYTQGGHWLLLWGALVSIAVGVLVLRSGVLVRASIVLALVYALIRSAPRTWWAWAGALVGAAFLVMLLLMPVVVQPLLNTYTPAAPGPTRDAVAALARATGIPADRIYVYDG